MNDPEHTASVLAHDHSEIDTLTHDLLGALEKGRPAQIFAHLDLLWARLAVHIRAEHLCLFPSILEADFSIRSDGHQDQEVRSAIDQLRLDHEFFMRELGTSVHAIRTQNLSNREVFRRFRELGRTVFEIQSRLAKHNEFEENHVYKWVNIVLGEAERAALLARIKRELENVPPRFRYQLWVTLEPQTSARDMQGIGGSVRARVLTKVYQIRRSHLAVR